MMTKAEHIEFWKNSSNRDWESVNVLYNGKQYVQALFFCHLVLEKLFKAIWIKDNEENTPPFSHNLESLFNQTNLELDPVTTDFLSIANNWNIEGRYQDYKDKFYKKATKEYTFEKINEVEKLRKCLLENLQGNI